MERITPLASREGRVSDRERSPVRTACSGRLWQVLRVGPRCELSRALGDVRIAPSTFLVPAFAIC
jgi:hypothetical protein